MKQSYKLPASLEQGYGDVEIALQTKAGVGLRPLPIKVIGVWIAAVMFAFLTAFTDKLPLHYLPIPLKLLYGGAIIALVFFSSASDSGGQVRFAAIRNMFVFMFDKSSRIIKTRSTDNPTVFSRLVGIKDIDKKTGLISFNDGSYAYLYRIVGNASSLLFDDDKEMILNRVDNFYRKYPDYMRLSYVTVKEAQKVTLQKQNLKNLYSNLDNNDKDIHMILQESYKALDNFVGHEFKSIHQYLFLFANSKEYVNKAHSILQNEVAASGLMFSSVEPLYYEDVVHCLHTIYGSSVD